MHEIIKKILDLKKGFGFVAQRYRIRSGNKNYYIDFVFYHVPSKRFVFIKRKSGKIDAGQISFYITAIDEQLRGQDDNPTIGLILCKEKDHYTAEYALKSSNAPIGVASYELELISKLPKELKGSLPTVEEIEAEMEKQVIMQTIGNASKKNS